MLERFAKWLYLKYGKPDFIALTREQLQIYAGNFNVDNLTDEEKNGLANDAKILLNNKAYQKAIDYTLNGIKDHMITVANDEQLKMDRFSINGVYLLDEHVKLFESFGEQPEEFDRHSII